MTRDLMERLRDYARNCGGRPPEDYLTWQAADEIERLQDDSRMLALCEGDRRGMATEIERLRAALTKIADLNDSEADEPLDDAIAIARAALKPKP